MIYYTYYDNGDRVVYNGHKAKVVKISGYRKYVIKFDDPNLMPQEMEVNEHELTAQPSSHHDMWSSSTVDVNKYCPHCVKEWKVTQSIYNTYYDCDKCGAKREDYLK